MNVCLATTEILGAHRNGGIGTATSHLAVLLADAGHNVTLLYGGDDPLEIGSLWHGIYHRFNISGPHLRPRERDIKTMVEDRKSTRLNSSQQIISYAVFCFKKTHKV